MDKNDLVELGKTALDSAYDFCTRDDDAWTVDTSNNDVVIDWRQGDSLGIQTIENGGDWRAWRVKTEIDGSLDMVYNIIMDVNNIASWNSSLTQSKILEKLDDVTMLTYQVTSGQRPIVNHRDFVYLYRMDTRQNGKVRIAGGCSVESDMKPPTKEFVRAWQLPGLMIFSPVDGEPEKCQFTWMQQCQYGGMMPVSMLNAVFPLAIKMFVSSLKTQVKKIKKKEKK